MFRKLIHDDQLKRKAKETSSFAFLFLLLKSIELRLLQAKLFKRCKIRKHQRFITLYPQKIF